MTTAPRNENVKVSSAPLHDAIDMPPAMVAMLRPPERLTVSQWADRHRYLPPGDNADPGPFRTALTPYMREPMDATAEPDVPQVIFIKCARVGGTEAINNAIGHTIDEDPMPMMYVQPTREDVEDEFTGRLRQMIETSPRLADLVAGIDHWNTKHLITTGPCRLHGAWPTNPQTMVRKTIGKVIFDEIDNAERQVGYLGNSLKVLLERIVTYGHRGKLIAVGTPTVSLAAGWRLLQTSDWRRYHVPCPLCGTYQPLVFGRIVVPRVYEGLKASIEDLAKGKLKLTEKLPHPDVIERDQLARYLCANPACGAMLDWHPHHRFMIDRGVWVPRGMTPAAPLPVNPGTKRGRAASAAREIVETRSLAVQPAGETQWTPRLDGEPPVTRIRGYHINVLYSPFESRTWSHILAEFLRVKDKRDELRVYVNSWLGEPWRDAADELTEKELVRKREWEGAPPRGVVPARARLLLGAADVQPDGVWLRLRAYGPRGESWGILEAYLTSQGTGDGRITDLEQAYRLAFYTGFAVGAVGAVAVDRSPETHDQTGAALAVARPSAGADGHGAEPSVSGGVQPVVRCRALAIDSGYAGRLDEVMAFADLPGVVAVKGESAKRYAYEHHAGDPFRRSKNVRNLFLLNTDHYKSKIHRLARIPEDAAQAWHLHRDTSDDTIAQLCSEHQVIELVKSGRRKGRPLAVWRLRQEGRPNHLLDTEVYLAFLADLFHADLLTPAGEWAASDVLNAKPPTTTAPKSAPKNHKPAGPPGRGFLG